MEDVERVSLECASTRCNEVCDGRARICFSRRSRNYRLPRLRRPQRRRLQSEAMIILFTGVHGGPWGENCPSLKLSKSREESSQGSCHDLLAPGLRAGGFLMPSPKWLTNP